MSKSSYTDEKANEIIDCLSNGIPLAQAVKKVGIGLTTWYDWTYANDQLAERFARAREAGHDVIATDTLAIADEPPPTTQNGGTDSGYVAWQKNRIWTRLQLLAKWDPKRYGDKLTVGGDSNNPLKIERIERVVVGEVIEQRAISNKEK
ncbi:MAG TPA: hypothetical protein VLA24_08620 [Pseudomonadales bacterium]|nr:hypothetical protein [Pseudomonadales bacterium]